MGYIGSKTKGKYIKCSECKKINWVCASAIRKNNYCDRICMSKARKKIYSGNKNPNWKGGKTMIAGRPALYIPSHPRSTKEGYVYEHIVIAEKVLGRALKYIRVGHNDNEIVHHVDNNFCKNENDNFVICTSKYHKSVFHLPFKKRGV